MMVGKEQKQTNFVAGHWDVSNVPRLPCRATRIKVMIVRNREGYIMLMEEIMHQLVWKMSHLYLLEFRTNVYIYIPLCPN